MIKHIVFLTTWVLIQSLLVALLFTMHSIKADKIQPLEPSYEKNIKPLFEKRCSNCHNETMMPDKNWLNYDIAVKAVKVHHRK